MGYEIEGLVDSFFAVEVDWGLFEKQKFVFATRNHAVEFARYAIDVDGVYRVGLLQLQSATELTKPEDTDD